MTHENTAKQLGHSLLIHEMDIMVSAQLVFNKCLQRQGGKETGPTLCLCSSQSPAKPTGRKIRVWPCPQGAPVKRYF